MQRKKNCMLISSFSLVKTLILYQVFNTVNNFGKAVLYEPLLTIKSPELVVKATNFMIATGLLDQFRYYRDLQSQMVEGQRAGSYQAIRIHSVNWVVRNRQLSVKLIQYRTVRQSRRLTGVEGVNCLNFHLFWSGTVACLFACHVSPCCWSSCIQLLLHSAQAAKQNIGNQKKKKKKKHSQQIVSLFNPINHF